MNKKTKNTFLKYMAVPNTHNLAKTITDKQNKYQELANEICAMWEQNAVQVIAIVISFQFQSHNHKVQKDLTCTQIHI